MDSDSDEGEEEESDTDTSSGDESDDDEVDPKTAMKVNKLIVDFNKHMKTGTWGSNIRLRCYNSLCKVYSKISKRVAIETLVIAKDYDLLSLILNDIIALHKEKGSVKSRDVVKVAGNYIPEDDEGDRDLESFTYRGDNEKAKEFLNKVLVMYRKNPSLAYNIINRKIPRNLTNLAAVARPDSPAQATKREVVLYVKALKKVLAGSDTVKVPVDVNKPGKPRMYCAHCDSRTH